MATVSVAGMSVAFPASLGVGLLVSTLLNMAGKPIGSPALIALGCLLILASVVVNAMAYRIVALLRHEQLARAGVAKSTRRPNPVKGIILAVLSGILIGSFGGMLSRAREGDLGWDLMPPPRSLRSEPFFLPSCSISFHEPSGGRGACRFRLLFQEPSQAARSWTSRRHSLVRGDARGCWLA